MRCHHGLVAASVVIQYYSESGDATKRIQAPNSPPPPGNTSDDVASSSIATIRRRLSFCVDETSWKLFTCGERERDWIRRPTFFQASCLTRSRSSLQEPCPWFRLPESGHSRSERRDKAPDAGRKLPEQSVRQCARFLPTQAIGIDTASEAAKIPRAGRPCGTLETIHALL